MIGLAHGRDNSYCRALEQKKQKGLGHCFRWIVKNSRKTVANAESFPTLTPKTACDTITLQVGFICTFVVIYYAYWLKLMATILGIYCGCQGLMLEHLQPTQTHSICLFTKVIKLVWMCFRQCLQILDDFWGIIWSIIWTFMFKFFGQALCLTIFNLS